MKIEKRILFILIGIIIILMHGWTYAFDTGFSIDSTNGGNDCELLSLDDVGVTYLLEEPRKKLIKCFDMNYEGLIALGLRDPVSWISYISIYSYEGTHLFSYQIDAGGPFLVELMADGIIYYYIRGDLLIFIPFSNNGCQQYKVDASLEKNVMYIDYLSGKTKEKNGIKCSIECGFPIFKNDANCSRLQIIGSSGETTTIYDETKFLFSRKITLFLGGSSFMVTTFCFLIRYIRKTRKEYRGQYNKEDYEGRIM